MESDSPSQNRPSVEFLLAEVISILTLEKPSRQQLERALELSEETISRARETQEWLRAEVFGRVNAATALLDLERPLEAKNGIIAALQKAGAVSLSAEDRIKALALLGACEKALNNIGASKAAFEEAIRFADRVVAGHKLPGVHKLLRSQVLAIKQGWGPAYLEVVSSIHLLREVVVDELRELAPELVTRFLLTGPSPEEAMSSISEAANSQVEAVIRRPLSATRPYGHPWPRCVRHGMSNCPFWRFWFVVLPLRRTASVRPLAALFDESRIPLVPENKAFIAICIARA